MYDRSAAQTFPKVRSNDSRLRKEAHHREYLTNHWTEACDLDRSFKEYSLDSITYLELVMDLEREFNISIPDEKIETLMTPRAVIEFVEALLALHVS